MVLVALVQFFMDTMQMHWKKSWMCFSWKHMYAFTKMGSVCLQPHISRWLGASKHLHLLSNVHVWVVQYVMVVVHTYFLASSTQSHMYSTYRMSTGMYIGWIMMICQLVCTGTYTMTSNSSSFAFQLHAVNRKVPSRQPVLKLPLDILHLKLPCTTRWAFSFSNVPSHS